MEKVISNYKNYLLTFLLMALALVYHTGNFIHSSHFTLRQMLTWSPVKISLNGVNLFEFKSLGKRPLEHPYYDWSANATGELGYLLRYKTHQVPDWILYAESRPLQWFFNRDDVFLQFPAATNFIRSVVSSRVSTVTEILEKNGITVLFIPIPTKISIERNKLAKHLPAISIWGSQNYDTEEAPEKVYKNILEVLPRNTLDLYTVFQNDKPQSSNLLYTPAGGHWTSYGIAITAKAVIDYLKSRNIPFGTPFILKSSKRQFEPAEMLPIVPSYYADSAPEFAWTNSTFELSNVSHPAITRRLVIWGTSFSARGLGEMLSSSTKLPLSDYSFSGNALFGSLEKMLAKNEKLKKGDILIWEFPLLEANAAKKQALPQGPYIE